MQFGNVIWRILGKRLVGYPSPSFAVAFNLHAGPRNLVGMDFFEEGMAVLVLFDWINGGRRIERLSLSEQAVCKETQSPFQLMMLVSIIWVTANTNRGSDENSTDICQLYYSYFRQSASTTWNRSFFSHCLHCVSLHLASWSFSKITPKAVTVRWYHFQTCKYSRCIFRIICLFNAIL